MFIVALFMNFKFILIHEIRQSEKITCTMIAFTRQLGKVKLWDGKHLSGCQRLAVRSLMAQKIFLGHWNSSVWYYSEGYKALWFCQTHGVNLKWCKENKIRGFEDPRMDCIMWLNINKSNSVTNVWKSLTEEGDEKTCWPMWL